MADKMQREIEEILAKLDKERPGGALPEPPVRAAERAPISLAQKRRQKHSPVAKARREANSLAARVTPTNLLFLGAGIMVAGLLISTAWQPAIWASLAGVLLFIAAFLWSFMRAPRSEGGMEAPKGVYWRDRFIEYEPTNSGPWSRLKRKLRRPG